MNSYLSFIVGFVIGFILARYGNLTQLKEDIVNLRNGRH